MEVFQLETIVERNNNFPDVEGLEVLLRNSPDFIMNVNRSGKITYVNRNLPGFSEKEVIGEKFEAFTDKEYTEIFNEHITNVFESGKPDSIICRGSGDPNSHAWYEVRFGPVFNGDTVSSVMLIVTDITRRREAEEALARSESRYRLLAENMSDFVWIVNQNLEFSFASPSVRNLLGYEPSEVLDRSWLDIMTDKARDILEKELGKLSEITDEKNKFSSITVELPFRTKEGRDIWTETKISLLRNDMNFPEGILGISRDITERKIAEDKLIELNRKLERSNNELESFAYIASHDLREPLRMVTEFLTLLSERYKGKLGDDADSFINFAYNGAVRMQAMIEDLLDFSRLTTNNSKYVDVDLNDVVNKVKSDLMFVIDEANAQIKNEELPIVKGDAIQLGQVFQNLIANSIKFCDKKRPEIDISVSELKNSWEFCVSDNGPGFPMKDSERIFNIFVRLDKDSSIKGTGIGLAMCKKIIERHKGIIRAESQSKRGAKFVFTLPKRGHDINNLKNQ